MTGKSPSTSSLPYNLPMDTKGQLRELAKIINIPPSLVANGDQNTVDAICATILYRHMEQAQRHEAMKIIRSLPNRELVGKLVTKVVDTSFVNPTWGMWSLTNEELLDKESFHSAVDSYASYVGLSASALGGKDLIKQAWQRRAITRGGIATLVIWGVVALNKYQLNKLQEEKSRRSTLNSSSYY